MGPIFANLVQITGSGDQTLDLKCTGSENSETRLMAVTSNGIVESQLQFKNQFNLVAPLGGKGILVAHEMDRRFH